MKTGSDTRKEDTRHKILELLKVGGPQTVDELSAKLKISSMGVRQHLVSLESEGLIEHHSEKRGIGRPSYVYSLAEQGDELFPRRYAQLALDLLETVRALDGREGLERLFEARIQQNARRYLARLEGKSLKAQVRELARIRTEEGFMADWRTLDENTFRLREQNCAVYRVACNCEEICVYEQELFNRVLAEAEVRRETHILAGDQSCTYTIRMK
jgi:predicted ArsR family transcriptional regulator